MVLYGLGSNELFQLGLDDSVLKTSVPVKIKLDNVKDFACGMVHCAAVTEDGRLYTWGCNDEGALGREGDDETILEVKLRYPAVSVVCGRSFTVVLDVKGSVYGWGTIRDSKGIIGFTPKVQIQKKPKRIAGGIASIACGDNLILMINAKGSVLAYGPLCDRKQSRVRNKNCLYTRVLYRAGYKRFRFEHVAGGPYHFGAVTTAESNRKLFFFGENPEGQFGMKEPVASAEFVDSERTGVLQLSMGSYHTICRTKSRVYTAGGNPSGQLGTGDCKSTNIFGCVANKASYVCAAGSNSYCVIDNKLFGCGDNYNSQLGENPESVKKMTVIPFENSQEILKVDCGMHHVLILCKD